jgi:histidinol-phosphate/aromatic aminotransferase/cobyric acid decarboxylase-like protein
MLEYQILIATIGILIWVLTVDKNVAEYMLLSLKLIKNNYEKLKWIVVYHPRNPITNWYMEKKYSKIAETLMKEFQEKQVKS